MEDRPAGERYFRHPGDVLGLIAWAVVTLALIAFVEAATNTSDGLRRDLGRAATSIPGALREILLAVVQVTTLGVALAVVVALVLATRWRRLLIVTASAAAGAALVVGLDAALDLAGSVPGALDDDGWLVSTRFPSLPHVGGAAAGLTVGIPWLSRSWRRAAVRSAVVVAVTVAVAGVAGAAQVMIAVSAGAMLGSAILVAVGAPNRNPAPSAVSAALTGAGIAVDQLTLHRAVGGRAQLYDAATPTGDGLYVKVYGRDSRDADLLYRAYRRLLLRDPGDALPAATIDRDVEHEALALLLASRAGVRCPDVHTVVTMADGSTILAMERVGGRRLDEVDSHDVDDVLLDRVWSEVAGLHRGGFAAHRALRAANVLVEENGRPVLIDFGASVASATSRLKAIDRAELLVSLACSVGVERAVASAARVLPSDQLGEAVAYVQPLALSAATRKQASKSLLGDVRAAIASATGEEPAPLEPLVRIRARTVILVLTLAGAFYVLLPQLANVDDSIDALGSANWGWLSVALVLSMVTYVGAALAMAGGVAARLPAVETALAQLASSFVNRVTPAKVGGLALNVRYLQKAGVEPAAAVAGVGLNVAIGAVVHMILLTVFLAWAGQDGSGGGFSIPASSTALVVVALVLAVLGAVAATGWGRRFVRVHVLGFLRQAAASVLTLARSPGRLAALVGGSLIVTFAYMGALICCVKAFDGGMTVAEVGAVYLGASVIAAAAPTPGGLGAVEAAFVAGLTALDLAPAIAVAAVLSYRLATFWLPILPGWLSFQLLQRRGFV